MMMKPPRCWRGRIDCDPLHSIEGGLPEEMTEADWEALERGDLKPPSFVCAGCVHDAERIIPQDAYRICWVNDKVDEIGDYDEQDLAHQMAVISQALAIIAARRACSDVVEVMTHAGLEQQNPLEEGGKG